MSISPKQAKDLLEFLERVYERPTVYLGPELKGVSHFLWGIRGLCFALFEISINQEIHKHILEERGWNYSAVAPLREMEERNLSDSDIAKELLAIEISVWKRQLGV
ncbi:MAG: hypothetical protein HC828_05875 [Blastochloris sp.]|nr:hypothetical protein [Blastochloris sp.]